MADVSASAAHVERGGDGAAKLASLRTDAGSAVAAEGLTVAPLPGSVVSPHSSDHTNLPPKPAAATPTAATQRAVSEPAPQRLHSRGHASAVSDGTEGAEVIRKRSRGHKRSSTGASQHGPSSARSGHHTKRASSVDNNQQPDLSTIQRAASDIGGEVAESPGCCSRQGRCGKCNAAFWGCFRNIKDFTIPFREPSQLKTIVSATHHPQAVGGQIRLTPLVTIAQTHKHYGITALHCHPNGIKVTAGADGSLGSWTESHMDHHAAMLPKHGFALGAELDSDDDSAAAPEVSCLHMWELWDRVPKRPEGGPRWLLAVAGGQHVYVWNVEQ